MNRGRIKKTVIALMAVLLLVLSASVTALAGDAKRLETNPFEGKDFSSCRLLVVTEDTSVFPEDAPILSSYNNFFITVPGSGKHKTSVLVLSGTSRCGRC